MTYFKNECLNNQTEFRLQQINKIEDYFITEIFEREQMGKKLRKYIATFDYFDKSLIFYLQYVVDNLLFLLLLLLVHLWKY